MASQFFGLNIAYTGLLANNASLNTTSNNIANVHTEGFSRQQVVRQASEAIRIFQTYGSAGAGVDTLAIERVRDEFYDTKYWNNNEKVGEYGAKEYYMKQIETYFADDGIATGFKTIFDKMMVNGLQELMKDPSSDSAKAQFVGTASALTEYFRNLSGNLQELQKDVNKEIKLKVDEINSLAGEIATLNTQINVVELSGSNANELRDRRNVLLDQLSQIVDIHVTETPIVDANDPTRETGAHRFMVKIGGEQLLVDTGEFFGLECVAKSGYEKMHQTDIDGLYDVYWENGQKFSLYNVAMGGTLQGLIQMRDGTNGEYFHGQVTEIGTTQDGRQDTVTVQVKEGYLQDLNKSNLSEQGGIISLGNREFYYDSWSYTKTFDEQGNQVCTYTFTLSDGNKNEQRLTNDRVGKEASIGKGLSYQGIPYYMSQMNEWIRNFSQHVNDIIRSGYDTAGNPGSNFFTGNYASDSMQYELPDEYRYDLFDYEAYLEQVDELVTGGMTEEEAKKAAGIKVDVTSDSYYQLQAKNFDVVYLLEADASSLATRREASDGVEQTDLLESLKAMAYDEKKMSFRGSNASEFLQCVMSDIALNASRANIFSQNFTDIAGVIDNQRISISGVDEDEEALNLIKFQNGYNLASKMIQTFTEIYDRLILETGV
ncbi:MAG: flagellar hook-associated protein FlgK [Lachnospiraceae bacterium]|nr:flagellar hook-associated protein FlgK [Lachnospiraceae bacterium]